MEHLHVAYNDKFVRPYIEFVNRNFNPDKHMFLVGGTPIQPELGSNCISVRRTLRDNMRLVWEMYKSPSIIFHGLFSPKIVVLLAVQPWLLNKSNWVIWGGDLYWNKTRRAGVLSDLYEIIREFVIRRFKKVTTITEGDYDYAVEHYRIKGQHCKALYINPVRIEYLDSIEVRERNQHETIIIQVGNSADPTNKHIDAFKTLERFKDQNILIMVPLSYGGTRQYIEHVIASGEHIFGSKLMPLLDFMSPEKYAEYLGKVHVAVFAHERQQALGNIFALLYIGSKVYIRDDISSWGHLVQKLNFNIGNYAEIEQETFEEFHSTQHSEGNRIRARELFNEKYIKDLWSEIFS